MEGWMWFRHGSIKVRRLITSRIGGMLLGNLLDEYQGNTLPPLMIGVSQEFSFRCV